MIPSWLNKALFYIIGWCVYLTQGIVLPEGGFITQLLIAVLLLVSLYYAFIANTRYNLPLYFVGLNILLIMFSVYGIYLIILGDNSELPVPSFSYLKNIYISLLPIYPFYVFTKEGLITEKELFFFTICFFCLVTIEYFHLQQKMLKAALLMHSSAEEFTNNMGYSFLALIPACVFFYKKPLIQYIALGYCVIFLLLGMKRGAILIASVCLIIFLWENLKSATLKKKISILSLSSILCFVAYYFIQKQMNDSLFFQQRIEKTLEGNSSGRDRIYSRLIDYYVNDTNPVQFFIGSGANETLKISLFYAHNDWLEIVVNQGLLGAIIYALYWILFAKTIFSGNYLHFTKLAMFLLLVIYLMKTFFSMSYADMAIPATFILGYCLAQEKKNEQVVYSN